MCKESIHETHAQSQADLNRELYEMEQDIKNCDSDEGKEAILNKYSHYQHLEEIEEMKELFNTGEYICFYRESLLSNWVRLREPLFIENSLKYKLEKKEKDYETKN
ncbi:MAG: hypothetical protein JKY28_05280 [Sulfurimonas sp.]|nr:hypothetical protein [Sulfurimonas sp.]